MKIGNLELKNDIFSAPMAGYSEAGYRYLAGIFGAALTYTEMISVKALVYDNAKTKLLMHKHKNDKIPCAVQLFGSDPEFFYKACLNNQFEKFELIDINMGCPVRKIFFNGEGSKLLENPELAGEIVKATIEGAKKPVTVKMRSGISNDILAFDLAKSVIKSGCSAITIHPRSRNQMYQGLANHEISKAIKKISTVPVIVSGDIVDKESYERIKYFTKCDAFMIGRASIGNPQIFSTLTNTQKPFTQYESIQKHIEILREYLPELVVVNLIKINLCHYIKGFPNTKDLKEKIFKLRAFEDLNELLQNDIKDLFTTIYC